MSSPTQVVNRFGRKISSSRLSNTAKDHNVAATTVNTNSYVLNKARALQKKFQQCGKEHLTYRMKGNTIFVMRFSPAAYELAKLVAVEQLYSKDFCEEYYISSSINEDECRNQDGSLSCLQ